MANQLLRIQMAGGGPYGFRLLGGDKNPLTVAKIRPSSKAQVAGLLEGDVILALNNVSSQGLSHPAATSLMEGNHAALIVHVLRGMSAAREVDSAMATLGSEVKRLTTEEASALVPSATSGSDHVTNGSEPYFRLQAPPSGGSLKQLRIARRESQSGDIIQTPVVAAVGLASENPPGYYAREERTSTDGGKTTRIVEEVKTEKFGGTTLTKVTKQEFSSYKSSSGDPRVDPRFQPEFSVARSEEKEEHGHPVIPLGGASSDGGGGGVGGGSQLRDERGWKTTTSVHKSSVRTEPYEVRIDTTQEPTKTYIIYQDGSREDLLQGPHNVVGRGQQPIPAIEVQFHPSESDFVVQAKPPRVGANPNFEIRVGKEVTFQPKAQTSYETTQSHSEFHPTLKVHESSIPSQSGTYSKVSHESNQTSYGTHPPHEPQSGYLIKQTTRTQHQSENRSRYDTNQQFGNTNDSRPPPGRPTVRFSAEPEYSDDPRPALHLQHAPKLHPNVHFRPGNDNSDPRNKPGTNSQLGYISESQPIVAQFHLGYNSVPQPSSHTKSGYTAEYQPGTHTQHGYNQELQPEINSQLQHNPEPQPRPQSQYGYNPEPEPKPQSQHGYNPEPEPKPQSQHGYNPESQPKPQSQYGYNPESQPKPQSQYGYNPESQPKPQSQYGYSPESQPKPQSQHGYKKEQQHPNIQDQFGYSQEPVYPYQPRNHVEHENKPKQQQQQQPGYNKPDSHLNNRPEQDHVTNPPYGYNSRQEPHLPPSQPTYNPESKNKASAGAYNQKSYEPESPPVEYNAYQTRANAAPFNRQAEAPSYGKAPAATHTAPPQWGKKLPHGGPGGPGSYNPPEGGVYNATKPSLAGPPGISRQMDRIERVEIASAPKWIPGSKLPTKQPSNNPPATYNSHPPPPTGDPRGLHLDNPPTVVSADGYYDQSSEGGWHEAPVAGVKNRPNVSFSRVHDPTKQQSSEADQSYGYGGAPPPNLKYGADDSYYGREAEESGQYGWPESSGGQSNPSAAGQYPAQGNVWRPSSGYGPPVVEERVDRSRGFGDGPAPPPPPPAPPLVPGGYGSTQPVGFCVEPTPLAPPPPVAPPIDFLKAYRGHSSSDQRGGYGSTSLEERVKVANSVAHSVLAPENQNTRGQKMFLRRREHSHKWTIHGPDPVPEEPSHQDPPTRSNAWAPKTAGPAQPRPPPALAPQQQQARPPAHDYPEVNGRPEQPPSGSGGGGGSASSYSLAEDMVVNSGKGGRLFAKRLAKADQWASAETTGRQGTPQNIRQGAPPQQFQTGYGSVAVPPSPGYDSSSYGGGGKGAGDGYPVANRLKDMIKPKNTTVIWNQQSAPQSPFAQGGPHATGPSLTSAGSSNQNPGVYRQVRFQGTSAISSSPAAVQNFTQAPRFNPKQFGNRATVSQAAGVTDL